MDKNENHDRNPIYSLISMLDEPDPILYEQITESISSLGSAAIPILENVIENTFEPTIVERLEALIHKIHTEGILYDLLRWKKSETTDLLQFLQILSKFHDRNLDMVQFNERITGMQKEIWLELNENLTSLELIRLINHFVFRAWNFSLDSSNMPEPEGFFLNKILDKKVSQPAALGAFYLGICQRLTLPVFYVGLPENFILAYTRQPVFKPRFIPGEILFYINPLLDGVIFNKVEIERFLANNEIFPKPAYFEATDNVRVAELMLKEMQKIYLSGSEQKQLSDINRMISILEGNGD